MENASKALIIAGGIFLALALITFGVYTYSTVHDISKTQDEAKAQEQLAAFNKSFEAYNKSIMHGTDLITVMNKAIDNNKRQLGKNSYDISDYNDYTVSIKFKFQKDTIYTKELQFDNTDKKWKRTETSIKFNTDEYYDELNWEDIKNDANSFDDFKRRTFECKSVEYSDKTGRIKAMHFEEVKLTDEQYTHK